MAALLLSVSAIRKRPFLHLKRPSAQEAMSPTVCMYSVISIKRTVLLNVLFQIFWNISIKRTVHWEMKTQITKNVLFLLNVLFKIYVQYILLKSLEMSYFFGIQNPTNPVWITTNIILQFKPRGNCNHCLENDHLQTGHFKMGHFKMPRFLCSELQRLD